MSWLSKIFGGGQNPADAARPYLDQIPGQLHEYYDPYVQQGQDAQSQLSGQYDQLMNDPTGFINALMGDYKPSEGYQYQLDQGLGAMRNSAASGGFSGTGYDQQQQAQYLQGLLGKDQQQFLQNALGAYGIGMQGEQDFYNKGYGASLGLGDSLANALQQQAGLEYKGVANQNAQNSALRNAIIKGLGTAVGGIAGGPIGAGIGSKIAGGGADQGGYYY